MALYMTPHNCLPREMVNNSKILGGPTQLPGPLTWSQAEGTQAGRISQQRTG